MPNNEQRKKIYTRFGGEVEIVKGDYDYQEKGEIDIKRLDDGKIMKTYIHELKADGGINTIIEEIERVNG